MAGHLLSGAARADALRALEARGWAFAGEVLSKRFTFADFSAAFGWMTEVAQRAETLDHHPDWRNSWNHVEVRLTTHSPQGFSDLDVALARVMDAQYAPYERAR